MAIEKPPLYQILIAATIVIVYFFGGFFYIMFSDFSIAKFFGYFGSLVLLILFILIFFGYTLQRKPEQLQKTNSMMVSPKQKFNPSVKKTDSQWEAPAKPIPRNDCPVCGAKIQPHDRFCNECGAALD